MDQAAIVENKVLSAALADVQQRQRERDAEVLAKKRLTLREEDLLRQAMGEEGLATRRPGRHTGRELAAARQAAERVKEAGGGTVDQLVAETVSRLSMAPPPEARRRSLPARRTKRPDSPREAPAVVRGAAASP